MRMLCTFCFLSKIILTPSTTPFWCWTLQWIERAEWLNWNQCHPVAERAETSELRNHQCLKKQKTFLFFASVWQKLRVTSESYNRQGPWTGLYVLCVNMQLGSHTARYMRRQHTLGRRHISAPHYDTLWYSTVPSQQKESIQQGPCFWRGKVVVWKNTVHPFYTTINTCGIKKNSKKWITQLLLYSQWFANKSVYRGCVKTHCEMYHTALYYQPNVTSIMYGQEFPIKMQIKCFEAKWLIINRHTTKWVRKTFGGCL